MSTFEIQDCSFPLWSFTVLYSCLHLHEMARQLQIWAAVILRHRKRYLGMQRKLSHKNKEFCYWTEKLSNHQLQKPVYLNAYKLQCPFFKKIQCCFENKSSCETNHFLA